VTAPKTKYPIEAFGPELMTALVEGGRRRIVIPFSEGGGEGKKKAHTFQRRIHTLRQRMRQENHQDYMIAARAKVSLFWGDKAVSEGGPEAWKDDPDGKRGALIVIRPHDSEFAEVLASVGITAGGVMPPKSEAEPKPEPDREDFEELLDELQRKKSYPPSEV